MKRVYVVGVSMTPFGKFFDKSVRDLTREAVTDALRDANCAVHRVDAAFFANAAQGAMDGQHSIRGELALRDFEFDNIPIVKKNHYGKVLKTELRRKAVAVNGDGDPS